MSGKQIQRIKNCIPYEASYTVNRDALPGIFKCTYFPTGPQPNFAYSPRDNETANRSRRYFPLAQLSRLNHSRWYKITRPESLAIYMWNIKLGFFTLPFPVIPASNPSDPLQGDSRSVVTETYGPRIGTGNKYSFRMPQKCVFVIRRCLVVSCSQWNVKIDFHPFIFPSWYEYKRTSYLTHLCPREGLGFSRYLQITQWE